MLLSIVQSLLPNLENMKKIKTLLANLRDKRPQEPDDLLFLFQNRIQLVVTSLLATPMYKFVCKDNFLLSFELTFHHHLPLPSQILLQPPSLPAVCPQISPLHCNVHRFYYQGQRPNIQKNNQEQTSYINGLIKLLVTVNQRNFSLTSLPSFYSFLRFICYVFLDLTRNLRDFFLKINHPPISNKNMQVCSFHFIHDFSFYYVISLINATISGLPQDMRGWGDWPPT